jgi:hypothetical protein
LLASFAAGAIVDETGLRAPFFVAAAGLVLSALISIWLLDRPTASVTSGISASPNAALSTDLADSGATAHAN